MLLLMLPTLLSLLDKDFMLLYGSIWSLQFHSWNCGNLIYMLLHMIPKHFSPLDKYFMIPFRIIISLQFHSWNCGSVICMLLLMLPTLFSLLHKEFMYYVCSHVINNGTVTIFCLLVLLTFLLCYHENISSMLCPQTLLYIFRNRVVLLVIWLYSSSIKTLKYVLIISCWSKS